MNHSTPATVGIAGVNTRPLHAATLGIAGNWGSTVRPHLEQLTARPPLVAGRRLGDRAARTCWAHAAYLLDYTYITCPDRTTRALRYRSGFARLCAPETRGLPVYLDSAAYREAAGTAPPWSSYTRYVQAIELIRPNGAMARDVLDDQDASREGYERLCRDGYADVVIPVWQARPAWDRAATRWGMAGWRPTTRPCAATSTAHPWWRSAAWSRGRARGPSGTCTWPNWCAPSRTPTSGRWAS